jgi:hypothetical protein
MHIDHRPSMRAVQAAIRSNVFGKWRRGMRAGYPYKANSGMYHIGAKLVIKQGHELVTAEDFIAETLLILLPERSTLSLCTAVIYSR